MSESARRADAFDDFPADIARVGEIFEGTRGYLRRTFVRGPVHSGWRQFLQEDGPPSAAGTACAIGSLTAMGVPSGDPQLVAGRDFLFSAVCADGGWSKPRLAGVFSLTMVTCLALLALGGMGVPSEHPVVLGGLDWLVAAQNEDGGWGNAARDGHSDTTATSYAVRSLTIDDDARLRFGAAVAAGAAWVERQRDEQGAWGIRRGAVPTVAHTSHGAIALTAAGRPLESLHASRAWLLEQAGTGPLAAWMEHYSDFPRGSATRTGEPGGAQPGAEGVAMRSERLRWTHLPAERALIALLALGVDPTEEAVLRVARDTMGRHHEGSYWRVDSMPDAAPSWAVLEGVDALARYRRRLEEVGHISSLRKANADLVAEIAELRLGNSSLLSAVEQLSARLAALESARPEQPANGTEGSR